MVRAAEALAHQPRPEAAGAAELGGLLEEVVMRGEEEGKSRGELVDLEARGLCAAHVFQRVGEGEGDFLCRRRSGFADMVTGDGDWIPPRQLGLAEGEDVRDQPQTRLDGVDEGAAGDVLLQDVVL